MASIRKANPEDIPTIQSIARTTWPVTFGTILSPEQITYMLNMMYSHQALSGLFSQKNHLLLLAEDENGSAMGFTAIEFSYQGNPTTKIHKIYLLPSAQGKGIGTQLFSEITKHATEHGEQSLTLNVNKYNREAIAFYRKMGFQVAREETIPIGNNYFMDDFVMTKALINDAKEALPD